MNDNITKYSKYLDETLKPKDTNGPLILDLFAGCGGLALVFEAQGFKTIGFEMVADYCDTYKLNLNGECHQLTLTPAFRFPKAKVISRAHQMHNELGMSLPEIQEAGSWKRLESVKRYARTGLKRKRELLERNLDQKKEHYYKATTESK